MELDKKIEQKKFSSNQKAICFVVVLATFVSSLFGSSMNLLVPTIGKEFYVSASMLGLMMTVFTVTIATLSVPFGRLADIIGKRRVFLPGIMLFSIFAFMPVLALNFTMLLVFRFFQAIGGAMAFSTSPAILADVFPESERGTAVGLVVAAMYMGFMVGPVSAGIMNDNFGWRSVFFIASTLSVIVCILAIKILPKDGKNLQDVSLNISDDIKYIFKLFSGNIVFSSLNLVALFASGVGYVIVYLMSIYVQVVMGFPSRIAGLVLITQPVLMTVLSPYVGKISDRVSPFKLSALGIIVCTIGVGFGAFINESFPLWLVISALAVSGIGFGIFGPANTVAVLSCVEMKDYGTASAVLVTMRNFGYSLTIAGVSLIAGFFMGNIPLAEAEIDILITTMRTAFIAFSTLCAVSAFIAIKCSMYMKTKKGV